MTATPTPRELDARRWTRRWGARLLLTTRGRLLEAVGASGAYREVLPSCSLAAARSYAREHGYRRVGSTAGQSEDAPIRPGRLSGEAAPRKPAGDRLGPETYLLSLWCRAQRGFRIALYRLRVERDLPAAERPQPALLLPRCTGCGRKLRRDNRVYPGGRCYGCHLLAGGLDRGKGED